MLRDFIVFHAKQIILLLIVLFIFTKLLMLSLYAIKGNRPGIFMLSLRILGRGMIENTFYEHLQRYYKASNKVNKFFYILVILLGVSYYILKFYVRR